MQPWTRMESEWRVGLMAKLVRDKIPEIMASFSRKLILEKIE